MQIKKSLLAKCTEDVKGIPHYVFRLKDFGDSKHGDFKHRFFKKYLYSISEFSYDEARAAVIEDVTKNPPDRYFSIYEHEKITTLPYLNEHPCRACGCGYSKDVIKIDKKSDKNTEYYAERNDVRTTKCFVCRKNADEIKCIYRELKAKPLRTPNLGIDGLPDGTFTETPRWKSRTFCGRKFDDYAGACTRMKNLKKQPKETLYCKDCLEKMTNRAANAVAQDWRPAETIAEDYYAA